MDAAERPFSANAQSNLRWPSGCGAILVTIDDLTSEESAPTDELLVLKVQPSRIHFERRADSHRDAGQHARHATLSGVRDSH